MPLSEGLSYSRCSPVSWADAVVIGRVPAQYSLPCDGYLVCSVRPCLPSGLCVEVRTCQSVKQPLEWLEAILVAAAVVNSSSGVAAAAYSDSSVSILQYAFQFG